jgi:hypothetical protein
MRKLVAALPVILLLLASASPAQAWPHRHNNPPGPAGGPGTNWRNPPGPRGGPGAGPFYRGWHYTVFNGRNWYWNATLACWFLPDHDDNPPGPNGGPGTNWENPPGPAGGPGASPDRNRCH